MTKADILGAVARGWCHPKNGKKEMDSDLAKAIADEIEMLQEQIDEPVEYDLQKRLATLLNELSREEDSNTPDFILAEYIMACLCAFELANNRREVWYGVKLDPANKNVK